MTDKPKRRWFSFSLRTLFVLVTILAISFAWYFYRFPNPERDRFRGKWWLGDDVTSQRVEIEFKEGMFEIGELKDGVGQIDFFMKSPYSLPGGGWANISKGIYRFNGDDHIQVAEGFPGQTRPTEFDERRASVWTAERARSKAAEPAQ